MTLATPVLVAVCLAAVCAGFAAMAAAGPESPRQRRPLLAAIIFLLAAIILQILGRAL